MTFDIRIAGTDVHFSCASGQNILDAALAAGIEMPYSCRKGVCGNCAGGVAAGEVQSPPSEAKPAGQHLYCQCVPRTNVEIVPEAWHRFDPQARKTFTAKVFRNTQAADDVSVLQLRLPTGVRARFSAGQYLQIELEDGTRRNYSMANPPHESDSVQLHVRHVPRGKFSEGVLRGLDKGHTLRIELPFGEFTLRADSVKPAILMATGTGFAPLKSIVEDAIKRKLARPLYLYWGARRAADLYLAELAQKWHDSGKLRFVPVLSEADDAWGGRRGLVHQAVLEDFAALAGHEVYACGNPAMTSAAHDSFIKAGLPEADFFSDAFVHTDTRV